jgi:hypothetical protein
MSIGWKYLTGAVLVATGMLVGSGAAGDSCESCPGDADGDCRVGFLDLAILLGQWGACIDCETCSADHDGDCDVDVDDLLMVLPNWGPCQGAFLGRCFADCEGDLGVFSERGTDSDYVIWDATIKWRGVTNAGNAIDKFARKKQEFGREVSVFLIGFGCEGAFSLGSGFMGGHDEMGREATTLTRNNAEWFGEQIKDSVTRITLWGCNTGADRELIEALAGEGLEVCAYSGRVTDTVTQYRPYYFADYRYETGTEVCSP